MDRITQVDEQFSPRLILSGDWGSCSYYMKFSGITQNTPEQSTICGVSIEKTLDFSISVGFPFWTHSINRPQHIQYFITTYILPELKIFSTLQPKSWFFFIYPCWYQRISFWMLHYHLVNEAPICQGAFWLFCVLICIGLLTVFLL